MMIIIGLYTLILDAASTLWEHFVPFQSIMHDQHFFKRNVKQIMLTFGASTCQVKATVSVSSLLCAE